MNEQHPIMSNLFIKDTVTSVYVGICIDFHVPTVQKQCIDKLQHRKKNKYFRKGIFNIFHCNLSLF